MLKSKSARTCRCSACRQANREAAALQEQADSLVRQIMVERPKVGELDESSVQPCGAIHYFFTGTPRYLKVWGDYDGVRLRHRWVGK